MRSERAIRVPQARPCDFTRLCAGRERRRDRGHTARREPAHTAVDAPASLFDTFEMTNTTPLRALCAVAALAIAAPAAAGARDPLYQWSDASGAVRYTTVVERIPEELRSSAIEIAAEREGARVAETPAGETRAAQKSAAEQSAPAAEPPVQSAPPPAPPVDEKVAALDARIADLEKRIEADETELGNYISDPERVSRESDSGEVAAIADRLPRLQDELRELRKQREAAAGTAPAPAPDAP